LKRVRSDARPQKRFAFTNIKPASKSVSSIPIPATNGNKDLVDANLAAMANGTDSNDHAAAVVLQGRKNENRIVISEEECQGKDVLLLDCRSCTIYLLGIATTVHAKRLTDCTILCYPVSTSIFIEDCRGSIFVVACQQLRMHSSSKCDLYLHVTTRAIIEDCTGLRVAPYDSSLDGVNLEKLFDGSNLDRLSNHWDGVQDFHWLVADQPSPNWKILPVEARRSFSIDRL